VTAFTTNLQKSSDVFNAILEKDGIVLHVGVVQTDHHRDGVVLAQTVVVGGIQALSFRASTSPPTQLSTSKMRFVEKLQPIERHVLDQIAIHAVPRDVLRGELELVLDALVLECPVILLVRAIDEVIRQLRKLVVQRPQQVANLKRS